ncbi:MAG TPA: GNAT family N-acetyltransferase [Longimicrobium sp.]|nr:GNAT family N-acetyltransferase [Longimicrobium sp.]
MPDLRISVEPEASVADRQQVEDGLIAFNAARGGLRDIPRVTVLLRDASGAIHGGVLGVVLWTWLYVDSLWVADAHRGAGHGSRLLQAAEDEAVRMGCRSVHLDTFGFQARPFYEKRGYRVFGELADYPQGQSRYYLWKPLPDS